MADLCVETKLFAERFTFLFVDVLRGCYKGEFGVDPKKYGCNVQAGQLYCFCKGNKCNNKAVPSRSNVNFDNHDSWGVRRMERRWW